MLKFINKIVGWSLKLQNFFFFIQAFQKGLTAFGDEWAKLTNQSLDKIIEESSKTSETDIKKSEE